MILLTGSSGFVGKNLKEYLRSSTIYDVSRDELNNINSDILLNSGSIVHLAGKAHDLQRVSNFKEYYDINFEITRKLYDQFLVSEMSKFVYISSVKAVSDKISGILDETTLPNPQTHYGKSKLLAEQYIQSQALPKGKSYYILRPCMIHGPGNKGNLNLLYQVVKSGLPYPLAAFENKRSFLSVKNLSFVIHELITQNNIQSGIYHVADDQALATNEVVRILSSALGKSPRLWKVSPKIIRFIAKVGDKLKMPLTTERLDKLTESYIVSNEKLKQALNKPLPLSSAAGLQLTAKSFVNS